MVKVKPIFFICLLVALISPNTWGDNVLTIGADEWMPVNGSPSGQYSGYMIDIARSIFSAENIQVEYQVMPWERAVLSARRGTIDCVVGAYKHDTPDFVFPMHHWGQDGAELFVLKDDSWRYNGDVESLRSRSVGMVKGYLYFAEFDEFAKANPSQIQQAVGNTPLVQNLRKLANKRLDTILDSGASVRWHLAKTQPQIALTSAGMLMPNKPLYLACSPNKLARSLRIVEQADTGYLRLKRQGKLEQIYARYGLTVPK